MRKLFDETFWKMLLGFIIMLVIGLASIFFVGYFSDNHSVDDSQYPTADVPPTIEPVAQ